MAARYNDGRIYPWGDQFDPAKTNTAESRLRTTTAVGLYPLGFQPESQLYDMSGNVREWCENKFSEKTNHRVLRSGSFASNQDYARAAYRYDYDPNYRRNFIGFRVCRRPPSLL